MVNDKPTTPTIAEILEFEAANAGIKGNREGRIRTRFGISPVAYTQLLNRALDNPTALAADPILVNRLNRLRERHRAARTSPTFQPPQPQ